MKTLCKQVFRMRIICGDQCKSTYPFAHLHKYLYRGCFRWIGKNAKKLKRTMFQQSAANLNFFPYRLHNEILDKKINSTHDCQDYIKLFNFWESKFQEISPLPRTAFACFEKRMAIIVQPLCMLAKARSHSRRSNLVTHAIGQVTKIFSITLYYTTSDSSWQFHEPDMQLLTTWVERQVNDWRCSGMSQLTPLHLHC